MSERELDAGSHGDIFKEEQGPCQALNNSVILQIPRVLTDTQKVIGTVFVCKPGMKPVV